VLGDTFLSQRVVKRWNSLDQETVDVGSINSFKGRLDKIRKTRMGFYGFCMVRKRRKALCLMEMGPHVATQGELQSELLRDHRSIIVHDQLLQV